MVDPNGRLYGEKKFIGEEKFTFREFSAVNMKNGGICNDRTHQKNKSSDKYVTLDVSLKFDSLENMKIISSESQDNLGRPGKGLITSLCLRAKLNHKNTKRKDMTSEISVRRTFQILLRILKNYIMKFMRRRGTRIFCDVKETP